MSILLEAAGVGPTYSCRETIQIPAEGGTFVGVACEFVFNRRTSSEVDQLTEKIRAIARMEEDGLDGEEDEAPSTIMDAVLDLIASLTVKARGEMKADAVLTGREEIRSAIDLAGVPLQVFTIWAGSQQKARRGN